MAKATPKDIVVEYFQSIKYFRNENKLIVILPDGLKVRDAELKEDEKVIDLELYIDELSAEFVFIAELDAPAKVNELLVLQAEDAQGLCEPVIICI